MTGNIEKTMNGAAMVWATVGGTMILVLGSVGLMSLAGSAAANPTGSSWKYKSEETSLGDVYYSACTQSLNVVQLKWPYKASRMQLCFRKVGHAISGNKLEAYVSLMGEGQILIGSGSRVKVDQAAPIEMTGNGSEDYSTKTFWYGDQKKLLDLVRKSKSTTIGLTFYQAGEQYVKFNTADLNFPALGLSHQEQAQKERLMDFYSDDLDAASTVEEHFQCKAKEQSNCLSLPQISWANAQRSTADFSGDGFHVTPDGAGVLHMPQNTNMLNYYPPRALGDNVSGTVLASCEISRFGKLSNCSVIDEKPSNYRFGDQAVRFLERSRLKSGMKSKNIQNGKVTISVPFSLK